MKVMARLTTAAILFWFSFVSAAWGSSRAQRTRGAALFASTGCDHCHTVRGAGGQRGPDLSAVGRRKSKAAIREQILRGSKIMPSFGDVLTSPEVNDLVAYLRSCRDKTPPRPPAPPPAAAQDR
jgi:mono/diheme cytochrome c family protein